MGLQHDDRIDAMSTRDGWAVLTMHHFDTWAPVEEKCAWLLKKYRAYVRFLDHRAWLARFADAPPRIELITNERVPMEVREICTRLNIALAEPDTASEPSPGSDGK